MPPLATLTEELTEKYTSDITTPYELAMRHHVAQQAKVAVTPSHMIGVIEKTFGGTMPPWQRDFLNQMMFPSAYTPAPRRSVRRSRTIAPPPRSLTQVEFIGAVIDLIDKHGWIKGKYGDTTRGFCIMGAIQHVIMLNPSSGYNAARVVRHIESAVGTDHVMRWNDRKWRTRRGVMKMLNTVKQELEMK